MANRRIGGRGGGSDPAPRSGAPLLAATVLAVSMTASTGIGGSPLGHFGGSPGGAGSSVGKAPRAHQTAGKRAARQGNERAAWQRMGLRRQAKRSDGPVDCVTHSFGEVRQFFLRTPCRSLRRTMFGVRDGAGNLAAVSVVWVTTPTRGQAREFQRLIDVHGTGDITPLSGWLLAAHDVRFSGLNYDSRPRGRTVAVAETEPASGEFAPSDLDAIAEVAALLPRPGR